MRGASLPVTRQGGVMSKTLRKASCNNGQVAPVRELCHTHSVGKIVEHRGAVLAAVLAGAGGSIALMLRAGHRQSSRILVLLFGLWVLSPFAAVTWVHVVSTRWPVGVRARLYLVMLVLTVACLALYASVAFGY